MIGIVSGKSQRSTISKALKRSLLLKILSKSTPSKEDLDSIIELTATKVIDDLEAQSLTLYLVEGDQISFKYVYYSPTLWEGQPGIEEKFNAKREQLLKLHIPLGTGLVGKVIQTGESNVFSKADHGDELYNLSKSSDFEITSMITVPLKDQRVIGAIQILNKEPNAKKPYLDNDDMEVLKEVAKYTSSLLFRILDPSYELNELDTARYISNFTETPLITKEEDLVVDERFVSTFQGELIRKTGVFPYKRLEDNVVKVVMKNPLDYPSREAFTIKTQMMIDEVIVVPSSLFDTLVQRYFPDTGNAGNAFESSQNIHELTNLIGEEFGDLNAMGDLDLESLKSENEESAPIVKLVNQIIEDAYFAGGSDIHIEPQERGLVVRYRIDGVCVEKFTLPLQACGAVVARVKIMCDLDIAQKRLPQDGRIDYSKYTTKRLNIDLRVATCPSMFGEKIVMRILDKRKSALPITSLGFSEDNLAKYRACIQRPYGMLLHCGPTGSGKSMTLFSALKEIASPEINIQTAEDPIEYTLAGVNQMQMNKSIGLTFAVALRSFLRMDPDVILVGEIRDKETAEIAIEAALTGHLLLSTLHTNDAPSTIARFTDIGIDPFMVSASMLLVCAQRLIRRICTKCCEEKEPEENEKRLLENAIQWSGPIKVASEKGCPFCGGSGMRGRIGIHELMVNNEEITAAINRGAGTDEIKRCAMGSGMKTLHQDAMLKVKEGMTTILEAISTAPPDILS